AESAVPGGAAGARDRDLPLSPSSQAGSGTNPDASISVRHDRSDTFAGETLLGRNRRNGNVAEAVEACTGRYPDIAFAILEQVDDGVTGKAVQLCKPVDVPLMEMRHAAA